ncbi:MAG: hypothetical protein ACK45T_13745, partial [Pseudanabaena sp.]
FVLLGLLVTRGSLDGHDFFDYAERSWWIFRHSDVRTPVRGRWDALWFCCYVSKERCKPCLEYRLS